LPYCLKVPEVTLEYLVPQCFEHIPVWYNDTKGKLVKGFLTKEKIIVLKSETANCDHLSYTIVSSNKKESRDDDLIRFKGHMTTGDLKYRKNILKILNVNKNKPNFMHTSILNNVIESTKETFIKIIGNSTFYYTNGEKLESENLEKMVDRYLDYFNENFKTIELIIGTIIITTIITILIVSIMCLKKICCFKTRTVKKINLIKSFLPTPTTRVNMIRRNSDSSIELDLITRRMLRNIKNAKQEIII
jgi:hypothetical protein